MCRCDTGSAETLGDTEGPEPIEYALARSASPALVACSLTELPEKAMLGAKLEEFCASAIEEQTA